MRCASGSPVIHRLAAFQVVDLRFGKHVEYKSTHDKSSVTVERYFDVTNSTRSIPSIHLLTLHPECPSTCCLPLLLFVLGPGSIKD